MDPVELNIRGVQQLVGSKTNKSLDGASGQVEGVESEFKDEFTLDLTDEELLALSDIWTKRYAGYEAKIKIRQEANKQYYLGRQKEGSSQAVAEGQPISANLLFEAVETFLPAALAKNPEPVVWSDNEPEGDKISNDVKSMLQYHSDTLVLRSKLNLMVRHWLIYLLGVLKYGWDDDIKEVRVDVRNPQNFIFDPDGFIDCYGDYEGPLGERITISASKLIDLFPKHKAYITVMVNGMLGTDVTYTEWWNDDYCFYTFKNVVLEKNKNPHFNYETKVPVLNEFGSTTLGEDGKPITEKQPGRNHFAKPKKPYTFLSVFSLEKQPHDETGLIEQNIPNQRRISRRTEQIDYNLSRQNNSDVFSENNFTQETAKQAAKAMAMGHPVLVPSGGPIDEAIHRFPAEGINNSYFNELENSKNDLRSIFGTQGITATQPDDQDTARGEILNTQRDSTRIGGGIGDKVQQVADSVFNWLVQLYMVYYDVEHTASIMGKMKAVEYVTLSSQDLNRKLVISVSPDSMKSHDETTEMNEALGLYKAGVLDPKTLLTRLNFPDPQTTAEQTVLWIVDQNGYMQLNFPKVAQQLQQIQQQQMAQQQQADQMQQEQQMGNQQAQVQQQMGQKDQLHQQKMSQKSMSAPTASSSLKRVPIKSLATPK